MENPIKMDDLAVPLFSETPIYSRSQDYLPLFSSKSATLNRRSQGILKLSGNNSTSNKQYEA